MALVLADRVQETTNTTGTGTLTLAGAVSGYQSFAAIGNANTTYYTIVSGTAWENGIGTYTSSGTTLSRDTILSSSNSNTAITVAAGASVFVTYPAERSINLDGTGNLAQAVTAGLGTGRLPVEQIYRLNSTLAGSNATGAQSLLGVGVTLAGSTVYQFQMNIFMYKTAGTTSHTMSLLFGGTATVNNIMYAGSSGSLSTSAPTSGFDSGGNQIFSLTASALVVTGTSTTAALNKSYTLNGMVSINAGGTFIPQYSLSAAPGGAYTTAAGSYFKISPLGASGANTNIGVWA